MNVLKAIWSETVSLFVDDGALALYASLLIAVVTALINLAHLHGLYAGAGLLLGCLLILLESVYRATQRTK